MHRLLGVRHGVRESLFKDVVVVGQPGSVGQEMAQSNVVFEPLELWKIHDQRVVEGELPAVGQDQDRHGGELFRHRRQTEGRLRGDGGPGFDVGEPEASLEEEFSVLDDRDGGARGPFDRIFLEERRHLC